MSVRTQVLMREGEKLSKRDIDGMPTENLLSFAASRFYVPDAAVWREVRSLMERVLARDPDNFMPLGMAAIAIQGEYIYGYRKSDREEVARAFEWANKAQRLNTGSDFVNLVRANLLLYHQAAHEDAVLVAERALELNPNYSLGFNALGGAQIYAGDYERGISNAQRAIDADPRHPYLPMFHHTVGIGHFCFEDYEEATRQISRSNQLLSNRPLSLMGITASRWLSGDHVAARHIMNGLRELEPEIRLSLVHLPPFRDREVLERYIEGLRRAGMPE